MNLPPTGLDMPSAAEIEAYYLSDSTLAPVRLRAVQTFVRERYLDGGTRRKFLSQRKRVESAIAAALDKD
jgi:hypothetical protein